MPTYVDAGVVRIQTYLARTPALRLRRGASWLITRATGADAIKGWLAGQNLPGVELNPEAGHADGVVSLLVPTGTGPTVAEQLLLYLRTQIPAAELEARWAQADTYLQALTDPDRATLTALPPVHDFTLTETCEKCRVDTCGADGLCVDCAARAAATGYRSTGRRAQLDETEEPDALGLEREVLAAANTGRHPLLRPVPDLGDLAALGGADNDLDLGRKDTDRNHVATVALDGNAMGAFFDAVTDTDDPRIKATVSPMVADATRCALMYAATRIVRGDDQRLPVVPHLVGGDDVVVSVVADRAWEFTAAFLTEFNKALKTSASQAQLPTEVSERLPTMSAGVVFAHHKFPFVRAVALAERALRKAKNDTRAAEAACCWLDVTTDGEQLPTWRTAITLTDLDTTHDADLVALAGLGNSGRQVLARHLGLPDAGHARAAALIWARRNNKPAIAALLARTDILRARNLVALSRWWRR